MGAPDAVDPEERIDSLLRDLGASRSGLESREAERRLTQFGPNVLSRRGGRRWPRELARQFTHPLALLLWAAAALAWVAGIAPVAVAIVVVILINAALRLRPGDAGGAGGGGTCALPPDAGEGAARRVRAGRRRSPAGAG